MQIHGSDLRRNRIESVSSGGAGHAERDGSADSDILASTELGAESISGGGSGGEDNDGGCEPHRRRQLIDEVFDSAEILRDLRRSGGGGETAREEDSETASLGGAKSCESKRKEGRVAVRRRNESV